MIAKTPKPKKCRNPACCQNFTPQRMGQHVCSPLCGLAIKDVNQDKAKKAMANTERLEHKAAKEKVKRKSEYAAEAQAIFNAYVRERDRLLPCISCGVNYPQDRSGVWDAGHLRSVGSSSGTRFNLFNVNKQCVRCNRYLSSNGVMYRIGLEKKIGSDLVDRIYSDSNPKRFSIDYLLRIKSIFSRRLKILKKIRGA